MAKKLTAHEAELAMMVAEGLTNVAIATRTGRSPNTVAKSVSLILVKLGVRNRAAIAAWAVRQPEAESHARAIAARHDEAL